MTLLINLIIYSKMSQLEDQLAPLISKNISLSSNDKNSILSSLKLLVYSQKNSEIYIVFKRDNNSFALNNQKNLFFKAQGISMFDSNQNMFNIGNFNNKGTSINKYQESSQKTSNSYSLLIIIFKHSQNVCREKELINIQFTNSIKDDINSIYLHPHNQNQLVLFSKSKIYLIDNLSSLSGQSVEALQINDINQYHNLSFTQFRWSYFDNYYGVLFSNSTFGFFSIDSNKCIALVSDENSNIVDFQFCPPEERGFERFFVFFLYDDGIIKIGGPIFPNEFTISYLYFFNMKNALISSIENLRLLSQEKVSSQNIDNVLYGMSILNELTLCKVSESSQNDTVNIQINQNLQSLNQNVMTKKLYIHSNYTSLLSQDENVKYKQLFILNKRPLTLLRCNNRGVIEVIIVAEEILPVKINRMNFNSIIENGDNMSNYQVEKIMLTKSNEVLINDVYDFSDLTKKDGDGTAVVIGIKGNVYYIKFDYIDSFNQLIVRENVNIDKSIYDFSSRIKQIISSTQFKNASEIKTPFMKSLGQEKSSRIPVYFVHLGENKVLFVSYHPEKKFLVKMVNINMNEYVNHQNDKISSKIDSYTFYMQTNEKIQIIENDINEYNYPTDSNIKEVDFVIKKEYFDKYEDKELEKLLNIQLDKISCFYENIINQNYSNIFARCDIMLKVLNELSESVVDEQYKKALQMFASIEEQKEKIKKNNVTIKNLIAQISDKIENIHLTSAITIKYINIFEEFEKRNIDDLKTLKETFNQIQKKFEEILQKGTLNNYYPQNVKFEEDILETDLRFKKDLFIDKIKEFRTLIHNSINELKNN